MRKLLTIIGTAGLLAALFALPALAESGVDEPWENAMNQASYWEGRFGDGWECTKFNNHPGTGVGGYDAVVTKSGTSVRVYNPNTQSTVKGPDGKTISWVMKCSFTPPPTTTTTTQPETTTTTEVEDTTTTTEQETTTTVQDETTTTVDPEDNDVPVIEEPAGGRVGASEPPEDNDDPNTGLTPLPRLIPSTSDTGTPTPEDTLPFTGPADGLLPVGVALLLAGGAALGLSRRLRVEGAE